MRNENEEEIEKDNFKIQNEAKELIEKTRRMMVSLDAHKLENNENLNLSYSTNLNSNNEYYEEKPVDSGKILKIEKNDSNNSKFKLSKKIRFQS